jgi:glycine hydroxymethyltransferase
MIMCKADYAPILNKQVFPGMQGGPLMHIIAAKAVAFQEALSPEFASYQRQIVANAKALAEALQGHGFRLVSGGTDTHLVLVDLTSRGLTGKAAEAALDRSGITVNKNTIPFDKEKPAVTSGIRIGTPAVTTRGMKEPEMRLIANLIAAILADSENGATRAKVAAQVKELCDAFPLYREQLALSSPHLE